MTTPALKWTDVQDIAIELAEKYPEVDPTTVRFTDLHNWVMELDGFADDPKRSGEKILEAIQQAWIAERE
jgi:FeS assembly protein IscX